MIWKGYPITEASWEPESHFQNAPLILEDYLRYVKAKEARRRVDGGLEEHKATGVFAAEGPVLVGDLSAGVNRVWHTEPTWMVL